MLDSLRGAGMLRSLAAQYHATVGTTGIVDRCYHLAGATVRICCVSAKLAALFHSAFAHREARCSTQQADLTIRIFASSKAPLQLPHELWLQAAAMWKANGSLFLHYQPGPDGTFQVLCPQTNQAYVCVRDPNQVPLWDRATPLRGLLNHWFQNRSAQLLHGAVVADEHRAVLLAGPGGSGKSTTALSSLHHAKLYYLGDDLCLVQNSDSKPVVHCLYNSAKVVTEDRERYAGLQLSFVADRPQADGKPTCFLYPSHRQKLAASRPLQAILVARRTGAARSQIVLTSPAEAWHAIEPSTLSLIPQQGSFHRQWIDQLLHSLPCYRLELGTRREEVPEVLHRFLSYHHVRAA